MRFALAVLAAAPGCSFAPGILGMTDVDAAVVVNDADREFLDARPDAPPNSTCYGNGLLTTCYTIGSEPTNTYEPAQASPISTDNDSNCDRITPQGNGPELCWKTASTITISTRIRYSGSRPIVLLGTNTITISGEIFIPEGAGANTGACMGAQAGGSNLSSAAIAGAGGGGGGAFGSDGGDGGDGENGAAGGNGGTTVPVTYVRGGCPGMKGGNSEDGTGGSPGNGGGGVYLISAGTITISGTINASGGGGSGGPNKAGGGGGGSGGLIVLDAPTVTVSGSLFANGGGGGEGGGDGQFGMGGEDPPSWDSIPDGGEGNSGGGNGGDGAYRMMAAQGGGINGKGGGGGGGGLGRILIYSTTNTVSPAISPSPALTTIP